MTQLLVQFNAAAVREACGMCGETTAASAGPQLVCADSRRPVCPGCGKKHAPPLAALVMLAGEAQRVGRIGRHTVFPPYTALLDLARAADNYVTAGPAVATAG
jgi:hypothetical protein